MKKTNRLIYGFMTVLIFLQYLLPIVAVAETLTAQPLIQLTKATVSKENEQAFLTIEGNIQAPENEGTKEITTSDNVSLIEQAQQSLTGMTETTYSVEANKVMLYLNPESNGNFSMKLSLNDRSLIYIHP